MAVRQPQIAGKYPHLISSFWVSDRMYTGRSAGYSFPPFFSLAFVTTNHQCPQSSPLTNRSPPSHIRSAPGFAFPTLRMLSSKQRRAAALRASADIHTEGTTHWMKDVHTEATIYIRLGKGIRIWDYTQIGPHADGT